MERLEDLNLFGLKIYQDDSLYCFTSDAVLLSHFATAKKGDLVADFCSGSGIVGLNFYGLNKTKVKEVHAFEMQKEMCALCEKTIKYNGLESAFTLHNVKLQDIDNTFNEKFSLVLCNPPYMDKNAGFSAEEYKIAVCKAEIELTLKELIKAVSKCLKYGGRFCVVHRADRLCELFYEMKTANIEPKKMQLVYSGKKEPYLVLVEGVKGGKSGLKVMRPIEN
jgi:tRNA1(Val) A37 N6-methylase TrmN6